MLDAEDSVELRALQARAYGRAGALSDAEAARLRELENARTGEIQTESAESSGTAVATAPPSDAAAPVAVAASAAAARLADADPASIAPTLDEPHHETVIAALRRHWRLAVAIVVVFALVGLALGWALFADRGPAPLQLTAAQQEWQNSLITSGDFDSGSVRAMREEEGVVIWFATKKDGADVCLVLGTADAMAPACTTREQAEIQGVSATLTKVVEESQNYDIEAQMFLTPDGQPAVITRSYITSPQSTSTFASQAEAEAATALAEKTGLERRTILVAGYDDDVPIWTGVDMSTQRYCLVYDGSMPDPPMACDDSLMLSDADRTLVLDVTDSQNGEITRYEYQFGYGQQYLTVTKGFGGDDAAGE